MGGCARGAQSCPRREHKTEYGRECKLKRTAIIIALTVSFICPGYVSGEISETKGQDAIYRAKLAAESLPPGMSIVQEVLASKKQLLQRRIKIGFPLHALLNQTILYDTDQARVNYLALPSEEWLEFGYSKLISLDTNRSLILKKDDIVIQLAATTQELEEAVVRLLEPDLVQRYKIRLHRLPSDWKVMNERLSRSQELREIGKRADGRIQQGIVQDFIISREKLQIAYYDCGTENMAEHVARNLVKRKTSLIKRLVKISGAVVVVSDSQNPDLNEYAMAIVNW